MPPMYRFDHGIIDEEPQKREQAAQAAADAKKTKEILLNLIVRSVKEFLELYPKRMSNGYMTYVSGSISMEDVDLHWMTNGMTRKEVTLEEFNRMTLPLVTALRKIMQDSKLARIIFDSRDMEWGAYRTQIAVITEKSTYLKLGSTCGFETAHNA